MKKFLQNTLMPILSFVIVSPALGPVDLSSLFLQLFVGFLYKAEPMQCGYST